MNPLIADLYGHQAWADAELWRAIEAHPAASTDEVIRNRLHHIHIVQRAFRWIVSARELPFAMTAAADFQALDDLKAYAREYHDEMRRYLDTLDDDVLEKKIDILWFKDPPLHITVGEALTQCAMHSHHHRAQNATRLRELGGEPPMTDLIVWYWKGRPTPRWT
jgi:uncharacterized damage-inducible protein DinB